MSSPFLPYGRQWIDDEDVKAVIEVLTGDYLTTGPTVARFEEALNNYIGVSHTTVVNSGTSALHAAYFAAEVGPGDEVIVPAMTFAATANAARYLGADVKFIDVEPDTANLDVALLNEAITARTKVVAPVDFTGHPADYDPINAIAKERGITVVSDAAHSFGALYKGRKVGTLADMTELSLHPVKPITTAEGGAITTDNLTFHKRCQEFRTHGITRDASKYRSDETGKWYHEMQILGFNYRLTDIQCALGISQLRRIDCFLNRRRDIAARYNEALRGCDKLTLPTVRTEVVPGWHIYVVRVQEAARRRAFFDRLHELGLGVQVHYIPVYWHPYYQDLGYKKGLCPNAEDYYLRAVSLPMYAKMSDEDVESSIERVLRAAKEVL